MDKGGEEVEEDEGGITTLTLNKKTARHHMICKYSVHLVCEYT
jgi:hypothetical protein